MPPGLVVGNPTAQYGRLRDVTICAARGQVLPLIGINGASAVIAGLIPGVFQQFAVVRGDFDTGFYDVPPYLLMIAIMLLLPRGLSTTNLSLILVGLPDCHVPGDDSLRQSGGYALRASDWIVQSMSPGERNWIVRLPRSHTSRPASVVVAVVGMLAIAGCAAQDKQETGGPTSTVSAPPAVNGFDPRTGTITVGDILALSGPIAATAKEQLVGQQTWFDQVNAKGGVAGRFKVRLVTADNQYNPQLTVQSYQQIQQEVVMFSGVLGTDSVNALIPLLDRTSGVVVPSAQDAAFRTQPGLMPIFPSYQTNVSNAVSYLRSTHPNDRPVYCAMVLNSPWGVAATAGLTYMAAKYGSTVKRVVKFSPLDTAFTSQIQELKSDGCTVVVFGGAANNLPSMVAAATQLNFNPQWIAEFIAISTAFKSSQIAPYLTQHVLFTGPGAKLDDTSLPGIAALRKALGPTELTVQYVYGYMQAIATTTLLEQAVKNGDLSGPGLRKALAELKEVKFEGLGSITLGPPSARTLSKTTTIYAYNTSAPSGLDAVSVHYQAPEGTDPTF